MGIVDDIKKDKRAKTVIDNTNTNTVGVPDKNTGLIGDQAPDTIFTADDFDTIRNQVNLEVDNFQLLQALNIMGQITNQQSQSGPMVGTHKNVTVTDTNTSGNQLGIAFSPDPGQVWQLVGAATGTLNASRMELALQDRATDTYVEIGAERRQPRNLTLQASSLCTLHTKSHCITSQSVKAGIARSMLASSG